MLMRTQPAFHPLPIARIVLPVRSRDELPPILAGKKATGRPGMVQSPGNLERQE